MKTFNILGDTQREQWHAVVNMLRQLGGDMDYDGRSALCDEIDRYIDHCEDILDEMREEDNGSEEETHKKNEPEVFYSGGNIWISAMYIDDNIYCTTDNYEYEDCLVFYDHRTEDQDDPFPCQSWVNDKEKSEFSDEEWEIYNKLQAKLKEEMH